LFTIANENKTYILMYVLLQIFIIKPWVESNTYIRSEKQRHVRKIYKKESNRVYGFRHVRKIYKKESNRVYGFQF